jgi:hypothetical protein
MIDEMGDTIDDFPGKANQTWCFAHVLNLIAKTVIKHFDIPKKRSSERERDDDDELLSKLAEGIELEEMETRLKDLDGCDDDNIEGWIDEEEGLSEGERREMDKDVLPVRVVIVKVRHFGHV